MKMPSPPPVLSILWFTTKSWLSRPYKLHKCSRNQVSVKPMNENWNFSRSKYIIKAAKLHCILLILMWHIENVNPCDILSFDKFSKNSSHHANYNSRTAENQDYSRNRHQTQHTHISLLASEVNPAMVSTVRFYDRNELYGSPDVRNCRMPNLIG